MAVHTGLFPRGTLYSRTGVADAAAPSFLKRCKGVVVLQVNSTPASVGFRLLADALQSASDAEALYADLQQRMAFGRIEGVSTRDGEARAWWSAGRRCRRMSGVRCLPVAGWLIGYVQHPWSCGCWWRGIGSGVGVKGVQSSKPEPTG